MSGERFADPIVVDSDSDSDSGDEVALPSTPSSAPPSGPPSAPPSAKRKRNPDAAEQSKRARVVLATLLSFTGLPMEMLQYIFSLCAVADIVSLYCSCSTFRAAIQGCLFLRKVNAMATLCNLSKSCMFFKIRQMYIPGILMLDKWGNPNHISKYLKLPVHSIKYCQPQDLSWFNSLPLLSLPERSEHHAFVDATVSFADKSRVVILNNALVEIHPRHVRFWKRDLDSKVATAFGNLDMSWDMKPVQCTALTKCYMFARN